MPVFDFVDKPKEEKKRECTYTVFSSNEPYADEKHPILILDHSRQEWKHNSNGTFLNQNTDETAFAFVLEKGTVNADILLVDARFVSLLKWLGENHIQVQLSGVNTTEGYAVYRIREMAFGGGTKLSAEDGFLQFMMERLFASQAPVDLTEDEEMDESGDDMKLTSIQSITDFMT